MAIDQNPAVPNCNFPTDNVLEVPVLPVSAQAMAVDCPVKAWGGSANSEHWRPGRYLRNAGCLVFYKEDRYFSNLWRNPVPAGRCGAPVVAELNYSLHPETPYPEALHRIWKKRWLSCYFAGFWGKEILVDLNVAEKWTDLNLVGVPVGWRSYATRGSDRALDALEAHHAAAVRHYEAGGKEYRKGDLVFLVYGGGSAVAEFCREWHLTRVDTEMTAYHKGRVELAG